MLTKTLAYNHRMTILIRGGGDLASGVALRLHRTGFPIIITELAQPLAVRRAVSFAEAVYAGQWDVEGIHAQRVDSAAEALRLAPQGIIPVLVDPEPVALMAGPIQAVVDARLLKTPTQYTLSDSPLIVGLGPGFLAGYNCHVVIETKRGHTLGRVYWRGSALPDSGLPEGDPGRVLRAPAAGVLRALAAIGDPIQAGQPVALIDETHPVISPISGVLRGIIHDGLRVTAGLKVGDVDPRNVREHCFLVSDKALAVGGGVLEAILTHQKR